MRLAGCAGFAFGQSVPDDSKPTKLDGIGSIKRSRRNLSEEQKGYLRGKRYEAQKKPEGRPAGKPGQSDPVSTAEQLAAEFGVSEKTIKRDAQYACAVDALAKNVAGKQLQIAHDELANHGDGTLRVQS